MKHYQCFLRRHSDGGRVLIMKISYIVIGVFGFLVFISFVIACVGIEIQFGKRIEQKGPKMVIPDWIHQKEAMISQYWESQNVDHSGFNEAPAADTTKQRVYYLLDYCPRSN